MSAAGLAKGPQGTRPSGIVAGRKESVCIICDDLGTCSIKEQGEIRGLLAHLDTGRPVGIALPALLAAVHLTLSRVAAHPPCTRHRRTVLTMPQRRAAATRLEVGRGVEAFKQPVGALDGARRQGRGAEGAVPILLDAVGTGRRGDGKLLAENPSGEAPRLWLRRRLDTFAVDDGRAFLAALAGRSDLASVQSGFDTRAHLDGTRWAACRRARSLALAAAERLAEEALLVVIAGRLVADRLAPVVSEDSCQ